MVYGKLPTRIENLEFGWTTDGRREAKKKSRIATSFVGQKDGLKSTHSTKLECTSDDVTSNFGVRFSVA